jgi:hypothetical protein
MKLFRSATLLMAVAGVVLLAAAANASADRGSVGIGGRFVCTIGGTQAPLAGAQPALVIEHFNLADIFTAAGADRLPYTDAAGDFSFDPITSGYTYWVRVGLNDADGMSVRGGQARCR